MFLSTWDIQNEGLYTKLHKFASLVTSIIHSLYFNVQANLMHAFQESRGNLVTF
jgi:hypothetical protein